MFAYCNHKYLHCDEEFDSINDLIRFFVDECDDVFFDWIGDYEYHWDGQWEWNRSTVEQEMKECAKKYFRKEYGQYNLQIFEDSEKSKIISEISLSDIIYDAFLDFVKNEPQRFDTNLNNTIFEAFDKYLETKEWHCGFACFDGSLWEGYIPAVKPVLEDGKFHWIDTIDNEELEPIIWFGNEDDYDEHGDVLSLSRQENEWEGLSEDFIFDWMDIYVDDYEIVEYGMFVPSLSWAISYCPIEMDDEGVYNPEDIDKLFLKFYLDSHPNEQNLYSLG